MKEIVKRPEVKSEFLVFTSAGDNNNVSDWISADKNYDIWVVYYGNNKFSHQESVNFLMNRKGGKFPNFLEVYREFKSIICSYKAIMISDDDMLLGSANLSMLFNLQQKYELDILQPSFDSRGKISHFITLTKPFSKLRYTNFVEVNCPIFSKKALAKFMEIYYPKIICHGVDWWYVDVIGDKKNNIAIADSVRCLNPLDVTKASGREINSLQSDLERAELWKKFKVEIAIKNQTEKYIVHKTLYDFSNIKRSFSIALNNALFYSFRAKRKILKLLKST